MYNNIGRKVQGLAVCMFVVEAISTFIVGIVLLVGGMVWPGLLTLLLGPAVALVASWPLYALGQVAMDADLIKNQTATLTRINRNLQIIAGPMINEAEEQAKQKQAEMRARLDADERAKRDAAEQAGQHGGEMKVRLDTEEQANKQEHQAPQKSLREKLSFALQYGTHEGMIHYLASIDDERVQDILKSPQNLIRQRIKELLEIL